MAKANQKKVFVFDREKQEIFEENVCPRTLLHLLYDRNAFPTRPIRTFVGRLPLVSYCYGLWQRMPWTKRRISKFISDQQIDTNDFMDQSFKSFSDFFVRRLKPEARPIASGDVVAPADGRYSAYENFAKVKEVLVKGDTLSLFELLGGNENLTEKYLHGSMLLARLAPADYHRFHSPVDCFPNPPSKIRGSLFSVHPIALRRNLNYITQNKRKVCRLRTKTIGDVLAIAVGATNVGSIHFSFPYGSPLKKGDELGYFGLGGSLIIFLFEPEKISFSPDLLEHSKEGREVLCKMGQQIASFRS